jgi:hypothetical protein
MKTNTRILLLGAITTLMPTPAAVWKYNSIYRQADALVGQWSDVVSIAVAG